MENRLRVRRAELDVTQFQVAKKVGVDHSKLSRIENGYQDPTPDEIAALARVLDTTPETLFPSLAEQQNAGAR
jgi:transcriptional regulator with XRE-family HTH domain